MAEIDVNAYATTAANAAAGAPSVIETQQPGATGALRQVVAIGDPTTRTSIQTVKPASTAAISTDLPAVVALHPSSPLPTGTNSVGRAAIDQTTNIIAATVMQNAAVAVGNGVNLNVQGYSTAIISISGTMSGSTIVFNESFDDVTFRPIAAHQLGITGNLLTTTTNTGDFRISCAGLKSIQAVITVYGTGSITVKGSVSVLSGHGTTVNSNIIAALPTGTNTIGNVGVIGTALVSQKAATSTSATLQAAAISTGNGTTINTDGMSAVVFTVSGTYVGTITFEGTEDGTTYTSISATQLGTTFIGSTTTSVGVFEASVGGLQNVRARLTWTSGTSVTVTAHAVPVNFATRTVNANVVSQVALPTGTNVIGAITTTDGTNIANVLNGTTGTATGQNAQFVAGAFLEKTFTTTIVGTQVSTDVSNFKTVGIHLTTFGTGTVTFQVSNDNTNWNNYAFAKALGGSAFYTQATGMFYATIPFRYFRINVTAITVGTIAGTVEFSSTPVSEILDGLFVNATQNGTWATQSTDGTNIVNVLKSDGTAAGQNSQLVAGSYLSVPFTTTIAANVGSTDAGDYSWVSVQIPSQGTSSNVTAQVSNDNTNWLTLPLQNTGLTASATFQSNTSTGLFHSPLTGRYFRLNVAGISAGTTSGTIIFRTIPNALQTLGVSAAQNGTWTVGSNASTGAPAPATSFNIGIQGGVNLTNMKSPAFMGANAGDSNSLAGIAPYHYTGTSYEMPRTNSTGAIIAAGATTAQTSTTQITYNAKRLHAVINISAFTSGTLTFTINAITASGYTYPLLTSTALAAVGLTVLRIFDGATPVANLTANDSIPRSYTVVVSGTFVATYGVDFNLGV